ANVERNKSQQFVVAHLGERGLGRFIQDLIGEALLARQQGVDPFLDGATTNKLVDQHIPLLSDAEGPVGRLILDGRVPPAIKMDDVRSGRQIQAAPARLERNHKKWRSLLGLKSPDQIGPAANRRLTVQYQ